MTTYDDTAPDPGADPAAETVGLGLGPLALPRRDLPVPGWVDLDYDREVPAHGDRFVPVHPPGPDEPALEADGRAWSGHELVGAARAAAGEWAVAAGDRMLVTAPAADLTAVLASVLVPLAAGSGVVLCRGPVDAAALADRVAAEQVSVLLGAGPAGTSDPVRRVARP